MVAVLVVTIATFMHSVGFIFIKFAHFKAAAQSIPAHKTWNFYMGVAILVTSAALILWGLAHADIITVNST